MAVTFSEKKSDIQGVAELFIDERRISYIIPPVVGTHRECFSISDNKPNKPARGSELSAYVYGALVHGQNDWVNQERILFPTLNYLRIPSVLTFVPPNKKEFGDLAGAVLVDSDLTGEGMEKKTEVPRNFDEWTINESNLYVKDNRIAIPYEKWYSKKWDSKNGMIIALFGKEGAEILEKAAVDSGRVDKHLWHDVDLITTPKRTVPVVYGTFVMGLHLDCDNLGNNKVGCSVQLLN